jgi:hypothetical protein
MKQHNISADLVPYISGTVQTSCCNLQDNSKILIELPSFREDFAEDSPSSPSISSMDDRLEEFSRLPDYRTTFTLA